MLRVPLSSAAAKRTIRPLYGWTQTTPKAMLLDPAWDSSSPIFPGMAMMKTSGDLVTLLNGTGVPYGLSGLFQGNVSQTGVYDEVEETGVNAFAVWVMAPDAEFEILAPAFDAGQTWTDPGDGTYVLVHARTTTVNGSSPTAQGFLTGLRGQLCPPTVSGSGSVSTKPVARLLKVDGQSKIVIGGLQVGDV